MEKDTVAIDFARAAVARLPADARERVLRAARIPSDLLGSPQARVPAEAFSALWLAVARELDDEFFGLDRRRMKVGSFALLCRAVVASGTLGQAIRQMLRGFAVFLDDVQAELSLDHGQAVVTITNRIADRDARRFADETFIVMVHGLMCWLAGRRVPLRSAAFAHPRPPYAGEYLVMYTEQLDFDASATSIRFDGALLGAPVVQTAARLKAFLQTAPQSVFLKYKNEDSWTARVRRRLRDSTGQDAWPTLDDLAHEFHVAPNTLRRRFNAEGTRYQDIKDQLRRDLAISYLCSTGLGIAEIGGLLGYQEPSTFYRAFKRWCGVQPGQYRMRQAQPVAAANGQAA